MAIWTSEIKELERLYESLKGQFPDLEKELERLIKADDENMILLYSRRCLEVIITDLCECELKRPRKTEPLKGIIDKLHKEGKVPSHIITSMHGLNDLSTYGAHPKDFDPEQVKPVLNNLDIIIKWYLKYKKSGTEINVKLTEEEIRQELKNAVDIKKHRLIPKKTLIGLISGMILIIAIVVAVLFFTNIIRGGKKIQELERSIAVLPFINDSPADSNKYYLNGIMEEVTLNLQAIKELRVPGRTSVEKYRNTTKSIPEIARELGVSYIVEGSGEKNGKMIRLRIQLLEGRKDKHIWGEPYELVLESPENISRLESQIAQSIAAELKAVITPEEKQLIERTPTASLTAHNFYLRGNYEQSKYSERDSSTRSALDRADRLYKKALENDPSYAQAYVGMAQVYWNKYYWETFISENFLDSVLILTNKALSIDGQLSEAHRLKGNYYRQIGDYEQAIKELSKAVEFNPNDGEAYYRRAEILYFNNSDYDKSLEDFQIALSLVPESLLPDLYRDLSWEYLLLGFVEKANYYCEEAFTLINS